MKSQKEEMVSKSELLSIQDVNLPAMSKSELKTFVFDSIQLTVDSIKRVSIAVCEWHRRGYDVHDLGLSFAEQYMVIGFGQVLAETFFRFGHDKKLWRCISSLPLPLQEKVSKPPFRLPVLAADGSDRLVDPIEMSRKELNLVFDVDGSRIRPPAEQRSLLEQEKLEAAIQGEDVVLEETIVPGKRGVSVNGVYLTWKQVGYIYKLKEQYQSKRSKTAEPVES